MEYYSAIKKNTFESVLMRWMKLDTGDRNQDYPYGKEMQKSKMAVWGGLTNSSEKKRSEKQGRKSNQGLLHCRRILYH